MPPSSSPSSTPSPRSFSLTKIRTETVTTVMGSKARMVTTMARGKLASSTNRADASIMNSTSGEAHQSFCLSCWRITGARHDERSRDTAKGSRQLKGSNSFIVPLLDVPRPQSCVDDEGLIDNPSMEYNTKRKLRKCEQRQSLPNPLLDLAGTPCLSPRSTGQSRACG